MESRLSWHVLANAWKERGCAVPAQAVVAPSRRDSLTSPSRSAVAMGKMPDSSTPPISITATQQSPCHTTFTLPERHGCHKRPHAITEAACRPSGRLFYL